MLTEWSGIKLFQQKHRPPNSKRSSGAGKKNEWLFSYCKNLWWSYSCILTAGWLPHTVLLVTLFAYCMGDTRPSKISIVKSVYSAAIFARRRPDWTFSMRNFFRDRCKYGRQLDMTSHANVNIYRMFLYATAPQSRQLLFKCLIFFLYILLKPDGVTRL